MKKYYLLLILIFVAGSLLAQKEETKDVETKKYDFNIDKVAIFFNFKDAELHSPVNATIEIKNEETGEIVASGTGANLKYYLPVNNNYQIKVTNGAYLDTTYSYNLKKLKDYEVQQHVAMRPKKTDFFVDFDEKELEGLNPEDLQVIARNKGRFERVPLTREGNRYYARLREGEDYEVEVRNTKNRMVYTQNVKTGTEQNTDSPSRVKVAIKDLQPEKKRSPEDSVLISQKEQKLQALEAERTVILDSIKLLNQTVVIDSTLVANNETLEEEKVEDKTKDKIPNSYEELLEFTEDEVLESEAELIEKQKKLKMRLSQLKEYVNDKNLSAKQKEQLKDYIERIEKKLEEYDKTYQKLRAENINSLNEIRGDIGYPKPFYERFWQIILALAIVIGLMLIGMIILYMIARNRRKQRDQLAELNEEIQQQNEEIRAQRDAIQEQSKIIQAEREKADQLLLNILPPKVADELKATGKAPMKSYDTVSILFTDFKGFTDLASQMTPDKLMEELNDCFTGFDEIIKGHRMEKIKTIGDAYMCAGGIPEANPTNPVDAVLAGIEMQEFMQRRRREKKEIGEEYWQCRLGINTGEIRAGVIGTSKFAYDIWGDPVNIASRMESGGEVNKVNISDKTYELVKDFFDCTFRGEREVKNGLVLSMYFVDRIKPELSADDKGVKPNKKFFKLMEERFPMQTT